MDHPGHPLRHNRRRRPWRGASTITSTMHRPTVAIAISTLALLTSAQAQSSANNFCGRSWQDASDNCSSRQPCPNGSDDECPHASGQVCFADTLCDAAHHGGGGGGTSFGVPALPYDDKANLRFCLNRWDEANFDCTLENWCGDGNDCPDGTLCFYSPNEECHLHDVVAKLQEEEAREAALAKRQQIGALDPEDPIRYHACGRSWGDANDRCGQWCLGEGEDDCPRGEQCFGSTVCYNDVGLVPSMSPTTGAPTTRRPTARSDPINHRFCGQTWTTARCTVEDFCPNGDECKPGESCFTVQRCHIHDLTPQPSYSPTLAPSLPHDHPSYYQYCGKSSNHAASTCSVATWCSSDDECPAGSFCFGGLPQQCNYLLLRNGPTFMNAFTSGPTPRPTTRPPSTPPPSKRDDPRNIRFCGSAWDHINCSVESHCPMGIECKSGELCFTERSCNILDLTPMPTAEPTISGPTPPPTAPLPTQPPTAPLPTTPSPTRHDDPRNIRFCGTAWDEINCSIESHCPMGIECKPGELCFTERSCNILDLQAVVPKPTTAQIMSPTDAEDPLSSPDVQLRSKYCGSSIRDALENCGIQTDCTLYGGCPDGMECFEILHCPLGESIDSEESDTDPAPQPAVPPRTMRPTPLPTAGSYPASSQTPRPTAVSDVPTKHPTPEPVAVTDIPTTKQPVTSPTEPPSQQPTTLRPTLRPTWMTASPATPSDVLTKQQSPEPTNSPTPKPATARPFINPTPLPASDEPTAAPVALHPSPAKQSAPGKMSAQKPSGGKGKGSTEQSPAKEGVETSEKEPLEEEENVAEETPALVNSRPRSYCFSTFSNFQDNCADALECGGGSSCPARHFCVQVDCKDRPVPNKSLDLCPHNYAGQYSKDCKSFYKCNNGYVGPTYFCETGFFFDLSSGSCIRQHLVNAQCFRDESLAQSDSSSDEGSAINVASSGVTYESFSDEPNPTPRPSESAPEVKQTPVSPSLQSPEQTLDGADFASMDSAQATYEPVLPEEEFDLSQWYTPGTSGAARSTSTWTMLFLFIIAPFALIP
ncbi:hypothetical protein ACHAXT_004967 [Thalassiosira profunda]